MLSEPRRRAIVPSSTTVMPFAATRWPTRPEKALVPFRLKSPSSPCPIASCSRMPGQPWPSTTVIVPGRRLARAKIEQRLIDRQRRVALEHRIVEIAVVEAAAAARGTLLTPSVLLDDDAERHAHERPHVRGHEAVAARDQHRLVFAGQRRHHLRDARIARRAPSAPAARAARPSRPPRSIRRDPAARTARARRSYASNGGMRRLPLATDGARGVRRLFECARARCRPNTRTPACRDEPRECRRRGRSRTSPT